MSLTPPKIVRIHDISGLTKTRCDQCKKKLSLTDVACKCDKSFCMAHRHPELHACTFDFVKENQIRLERLNPRVVANKLEHI